MKNFKNIFSNGNQIFFKYLWSQMLDCIIVAIITSIAMSIMGVKYSVLLGILIGISNLVPYFGAIFGVTIAIIITLLTGGWEQALIMAIVVIVLQQIDANLINPRITSQSLKVSPLFSNVFCNSRRCILRSNRNAFRSSILHTFKTGY